MTLDSRTLGSMHICVSWLRLTRVQLVTAPPTYLPRSSSSRTIRSSTAVALNSLMLGACSRQSQLCAVPTVGAGAVRLCTRPPAPGCGSHVTAGQNGCSQAEGILCCQKMHPGALSTATPNLRHALGEFQQSAGGSARTCRTLERMVEVKREACLMTT